MKTKILFILICSILFTAIGKSEAPAGLFPKIQGWTLKVEKMVYTPDNLWELINGAAEAFLSYDFQDLHLGEYSKENVSVRAELYRHSNLSNAFGIYTAERMPDYSFIDIGIQGYAEPGILHFFTGTFYIKLMTAGAEEADEQTLKDIAININNYLGMDNHWPRELDLLPEENRVKNTESYIAEDFLGYSFFHSAFIAKYNDQDEFQVFIITLNSSEDARAVAKKYFDLIKCSDPVADRKYTLNDPFNDTIYMGIKKNYLFGVVNLNNQETAYKYLEKIEGKIN
ncbi:MAG: hypothetical protein JXJ22_05755 [Bacteroidales bacterium]|nr:hypothetical protein [Bacteroidales bacterium]